jgi:hypothetical protein
MCKPLWPINKKTSMLAITKEHNKIEIIFPIAIIGFSVLNIFNQTIYHVGPFINYPSIIISLIGIAGGTLYFLKKKIYSRLIYIWAVSQALIFTSYFPDYELRQVIERPFWNVSQILNLSLGFNWQTKETSYTLHFNFASILFIGFAQILYLTSLYGTKINLRPFKADSSLKTFLPTSATIEKRVTLSKEKNWLLVRLDKINSESSVEYALIKPKESGETIKPNKKNQIIYFLLVEDPAAITETSSKADFTKGDWAVLN